MEGNVVENFEKRNNKVQVKTKKKKTNKWIEKKEREREKKRINVGWEKKARI